MTFAVKNITELKKVRGADTYKKKLIIEKDGIPTYCAIYYEGLTTPFLYDYGLDETISQHNWYIGQNGYATSRSLLMHQIVFGETYDTSKLSIDHINQVKTDNRRANLRLTTQSNQNSNRPSRIDRLPPPQELIDIGITEMLRHIRWNKTDERFVIEKHPGLLKRVEMGLIKKPSMNCTRLSKFNIVQKYQDALARYIELSKDSGQDLEFLAKRDLLLIEYKTIVEALKQFLDVELHLPSENHASVFSAILEGKRATAPTKHTDTVIPPEYKITHGDLPRFCQYKKADSKRKDGFLIEKHSALMKEGLKKGGSWNIRRDLPPLEKRRIFLEKYVELQKAANLPIDTSGHTQGFLDILTKEGLM